MTVALWFAAVNPRVKSVLIQITKAHHAHNDEYLVHKSRRGFMKEHVSNTRLLTLSLTISLLAVADVGIGFSLHSYAKSNVPLLILELLLILATAAVLVACIKLLAQRTIK